MFSIELVTHALENELEVVGAFGLWSHLWLAYFLNTLLDDYLRDYCRPSLSELHAFGAELLRPIALQI